MKCLQCPEQVPNSLLAEMQRGGYRVAPLPIGERQFFMCGEALRTPILPHSVPKGGLHRMSCGSHGWRPSGMPTASAESGVRSNFADGSRHR